MDDDAGLFSSDEQGESWEAQRERRTRALHELAQQRVDNGQGAPEPHAPDERLRRPSTESLPRLTLPARRFPARRRLGIALLSVVLLIAIVAMVLWRNTRPPVTTIPQASLPIVTLTPAADGVICPVGVAWSPDATRVAVLGYTPVAVHAPYCFSQAYARPGERSADVRWSRARLSIGSGTRWNAASLGWAPTVGCSSVGSISSLSIAASARVRSCACASRASIGDLPHGR